MIDSAWYSLYTDGPRNAESARYFQRWIDKLDTMARAWPWWRNGQEQTHVLGQFDEARKIYKNLEQEAQ